MSCINVLTIFLNVCGTLTDAVVLADVFYLFVSGIDPAEAVKVPELHPGTEEKL